MAIINHLKALMYEEWNRPILFGKAKVKNNK